MLGKATYVMEISWTLLNLLQKCVLLFIRSKTAGNSVKQLFNGISDSAMADLKVSCRVSRCLICDLVPLSFCIPSSNGIGPFSIRGEKFKRYPCQNSGRTANMSQMRISSTAVCLVRRD